MTDQNSVILRGSLAGVNPRRIGQQDRVLYEVHVSLTKPAARGREAEVMVVPVTVWAPSSAWRWRRSSPGHRSP